MKKQAEIEAAAAFVARQKPSAFELWPQGTARKAFLEEYGGAQGVFAHIPSGGRHRVK